MQAFYTISYHAQEQNKRNTLYFMQREEYILNRLIIALFCNDNVGRIMSPQNRACEFPAHIHE